MTLDDLLTALKQYPETVEFDDTMAVIDSGYVYTPAAFRNGDLTNDTGQNVGSCKIFAFARLNGLSEEQTLHCFGRFYRHDVLNDPSGSGHQNIRQFMRTGWAGVEFDELPLVRREPELAQK